MFLKNSVMIGLWTILFAVCNCQKIGDQLQANRRHFSGEEFYPPHGPEEAFHDDDEYYYHHQGPQGRGFHHPEPHFQNVRPYQYPSIPSVYQPMPVDNIRNHDYGGYQGYFPREPYYEHHQARAHEPYFHHQARVHEPYFEPQVRAGAFDSPFTKVLDPMKKMGDSMKEVGESMGKQAEDAGKQMTEAIQKPAEEMGKQVEAAQEKFGEHVEGMRERIEEARSGLPTIPTTTESDPKKSSEDGASGDGEEMPDAEKGLKDGASDPMKKMKETGDKLKKSFPSPGSLLMGGIKDETTEAHEDETDFPRAGAMEWGSPDFVDVRYQQPRGGYFDYY